MAKFLNLGIVLAGIILGQAILYGPSLLGRKILLPLDILAKPAHYLPQSPEIAGLRPHNEHLMDLVVLFEPARRFAVSEFRAGRLPAWTPCHYCGAPAAWPLPRFSPFMALEYCIQSPVVLAWTQLLLAIFAGLGAYAFCRCVLAVSFWPAAIAAWCYPLTGFFVLFQGATTSAPLHCLPWMLWAVDATVRRRSALAPAGLSAMTCLTLASGHLDVVGQVLIVSGLYGLWCLWDTYPQQWFHRQGGQAVITLSAAWGLGFLLAAPAILPVLEYVQTGARVSERGTGGPERPPVGLPALPQFVLPKMYGATEPGSFPIFPPGQPTLAESTAAGYAGVWATLLVAPLAWCSRRHRSINIFWICLVVLGLAWSINLTPVVSIMRLSGLNRMSFNRLVFASSFAILALAAVGLEVLLQGRPRWRSWFWAPAAVPAGLCVWCLCRSLSLPELIGTRLEPLILQGQTFEWARDLDDVGQIKAWFAETNLVAAILCGLGAGGWLLLGVCKTWRPLFVQVLGLLLVGDLLLFGFGRAAQCDAALYYPQIPVLEDVARSAPGRIVGAGCLPANLAQICGLRDIRGYDGVDPARLVELITLGAGPGSPALPYARAQWLLPKVTYLPEGTIRLSPVFDMLGVRYVIFSDARPPEGQVRPAFQGSGYQVLVNSNALPRVFVPKRVEVVSESAKRLEKLASPEFDPRQVAYVEAPVDLPNACDGTAEIVEEIPTHVKVAAQMKTPGLLVLADSWDKGWRACLNGKSAPILRANHAIRGVVLPAGAATLEFRYEPASFVWGLRLAGLGAIVLATWAALAHWTQTGKDAFHRVPLQPTRQQ